jgi:molybdopterin-guanine dinucleotide biosynthesis protein A
MAIAGILLAAGSASRMGVNKLLVPLEGEPLVRRMARRALAAGLLQATSLSVPVVAVRIGAQLHTIDSDTGAAIIAAGLLTVVLFPPLALMLISRDGADDRPHDTEGPDAPADNH